MAKDKTKAGWADCKAAMAKWPRNGVIALVHELYQLCDENRCFLHGRLLPDKAPDTLAKTQQLIGKMVSVNTVFREGISQRDLKRVVDQFAKAVDDPAMVARLLLFDIAASIRTFNEVGDYEPLVDHIYASMGRLEKCLRSIDLVEAKELVAELSEIANQWSGKFGYGLSDELDDFAAEWREKLE